MDRHGTSESAIGWCLAGMIILCIFEGAIRKWVFRDESPIIHGICYFSKDVMLSAAMLFAVRRQRPDSRLLASVRSLLTAMTLMITGGVIISVDGFAPVGALVSVRNLVVLPWAAYFIGPLFRPREIVLVCHVIGVSAIANAVLGGMQFFLPASDVLNYQSKSDVEAISDVGRVRASGTFVYQASMGNLCAIACWAGTVLIAAKPRHALGYCYLIAGLTCTSAAMSRAGAVYGVVITLGGLGWNPVTRGRLLIVVIGGSVVVLGGSTGDHLFGKPDDTSIVDALLTRHSKADGVTDRLEWIVMNTPMALLDVPLGTGLGRGQTGQKAVDDSHYAFVYEVELARIVYEIGAVGLTGVLVWRVGLPMLLVGRARLGWRQPSIWAAVWYPSWVYMPLGIVMYLCFDHVMATFLLVVTSAGLAATAARELHGTGVAV